jgi:hypothetical protein
MWFILYFLLLIKALKRVPMPIYINSRIVNSQNHGVDMISDALLFLSEYPAACCGWDGQETDLRMAA